jgi:hypothetical protein
MPISISVWATPLSLRTTSADDGTLFDPGRTFGHDHLEPVDKAFHAA